MNQDQLTMTDQADQDQDLDQTMMKNHLKEEKSLKESQATSELLLLTRQEG